MTLRSKLALFVLGVAVAVGPPAFSEEPGPVRHPVLRHDVDPKNAARYERAVSRVMAMDEAEMLRLVPVKSCIMFCGCPNCSAGQQENGQFAWTIERPMELVCKFCRHVYPSDDYPMDQTASGTNALGETVTYRYYLDPKSGRDFWLEAYADRLRRNWFVEQCQSLAVCYRATGDEKYARRAALILERFAQAYPHMAVLSQWPYRRRAIVKPTPPYPWNGGKWGRWMAEEVPQGLPEAYDLIHDSPELDKLGKELGRDVRQAIENDFFRAAVEYTFTFGAEPIGQHLNNMAPFYTRNIVHIGRVVGEPRYVHWGHRWVGEILREGFYYDGMWREAPSYHYQTIIGIRRVIAALDGYSDPPDYRPESGDARLENVDLQRQVPFVQKALLAPALVGYPNGRICPVHDTWATSRQDAPRQATVSALLPGFGQASLGRGGGADQLQAQLHFSGGHGHEHADNLSFSLFAKGAEMLSDIGYSHTRLRGWTISTVGHNTVAIDRQEQKTTNSDGDLVMFLPDAAGLSVVEARAERAYPGLADRYRRQLLLVPVSPTDAYVVDLFRVQGGTVHDWLLLGAARAAGGHPAGGFRDLGRADRRIVAREALRPDSRDSRNQDGGFVRGHVSLSRNRRTGSHGRRAHPLARGTGHGDLSGQGSANPLGRGRRPQGLRLLDAAIDIASPRPGAAGKPLRSRPRTVSGRALPGDRSLPAARSAGGRRGGPGSRARRPSRHDHFDFGRPALSRTPVARGRQPSRTAGHSAPARGSSRGGLARRRHAAGPGRIRPH
jgi:hypothetical protein